MTFIGRFRSLPGKSPRVRQLRRHHRQLVPVIVQVLVVTALGCRQDTESPSAPPSQAFAGTLTTALSFRQISTAFNHTCAVTTANRAYCWGFNSRGQVGDGTAGGNSGTPAAVLGGLQFQQVRPGRTQTCGVTTNNRAFCWGLGGTLGDGTSNNHSTPVAVVGGLQFRQVSAGGNTAGHACGVTLGNVAYCWGENSDGQLATARPPLARNPCSSTPACSGSAS